MDHAFPSPETIFAQAIEIESPEDRSAFLQQACQGDAQLLAELEQLVQDHFRTGNFLERPAIDRQQTSAYCPVSETAGAQIGPYKLLQQIGEGGMGVVCMAEQQKPVRRRVALKIIKPGMDSRQVIARFEAERQALAMMDHPNIARVLDAGCTESGRPYFAMELVQGIPITQYCDDKQLPPQERLELFVEVCHAVQHAHQKGIIHRDLKPSNVLVMIYDGKPLPKIIDFGVAKALHQQLTEKTMFTQFGAIVGTLEYMSPEQAQSDAMGTDTRSDIYSLGVLLYELLTGTTPMDGKKLRSLGYAEMLKTIREVDPPKPSTRLSQSQHDLANISAKRHTEPRRLQKLIAGDLDWIVMKCLEKDRTRRYETANGLALDIQRHLQNEAVSASPPGQFYKLQKMVRRNKLACTAAACVMLALILGLAASLWQAGRAEREAARATAALAEAQQQKALADQNFREARGAVEDLLRISDERLKDQAGLQPLRIELIKAAIDRYEPFLSQPIPDPTPREELARLYAGYGQLLLERTEVFDQSVMDAFEKARKLQEQLLKEHPGDRMLRQNLGWTCILEEWRPHTIAPTPEQVGRQAIDIFRQLVAENPSDPFARDDLVWALWRTTRYVDPAEALKVVNESIALGEQLVQEYPASAEFRRELANALNVKSIVLLGHNPTPQSAAAAMPFRIRGLELHKAIWADMKAARPAIFQPERPQGDEARMISISPMWAEFDVALLSDFLAGLYKVQGDWPHTAEMDAEAAQYYKDLVEHNPTVATFTGDLVNVFNDEIEAAKQENDRQQVAAWSKDAVAFWNRQLDLHPDLPDLKKYADDAAKQDSEVAQWLATPSTQP